MEATSSAKLTSMSFGVKLASDTISVEAGSTTPFPVEIVNDGPEPDLFELLVEGLDPVWTTQPVESFSVPAGSSHRDTLILRVPRDSESAAGNYPFVLRVRSLNSGESHSVQAMLVVEPFHQLSIDVEPKRAVAGGLKPQTELEVKIMNLGNSEHQLQLFVTDPETECLFTVLEDKVQLSPGQQKTVVVQAGSRKRSLVSNAKLFSVNTSVRSVTHPTVAAYAQSQLEIRPAVGRETFIGGSLLAILAVAWWVSIPKEPRITSFQADRKQLEVGEPVMLTFETVDAERVRLRANGDVIRVLEDGSGTVEFRPENPGRYEFSIEAMRGSRTVRQQFVLEAAMPEVAPLPEIQEFSVDRREIERGKPLTVRFRLSNSVSKAELRPIGIFTDRTQSRIQFIPNWFGESEVILIAHNATGQTVQRSVRVRVVDPKPVVVTFRNTQFSTKQTFGPDAKFTVTWDIQNATRAEIEWNGSKTEIPVSGSREFPVVATGTLILRGFGPDGKAVEERHVIEWSPEAPSNDPASPGGTTPNPTDGTTPPSTGAGVTPPPTSEA